MPGNEVADKVHNFFEQDNLSPGEHSSQPSRSNWPVLNSNLWVGNQGPIGAPLSSNTGDYTIQQSDFERGNGKRPQTLVGTNDAQLNTRPEFGKGQYRNEELSLNGSMHGQQGFQVRQNEDVVSNRVPRGLSVNERQQGNAHEHHHSFRRTSEKLGTSEAPVNFDFLGRQQQLMRSQQSGMPQSQPRQQSGISDLQSWQQQMVFKQLQELQKQRQFELQLNQETRQHNAMSQLPSMAKMATNEQLPSMTNGIPIRDASSYMWLNENMGGDSKVANNSQTFVAGNMNWGQHGGSSGGHGIHNGVLLSTEQAQMLRAMGVVPQHEQSLYGAPVASTRGAFNHYSHMQGISQDSAPLLSRASGTQLEKPLTQSASLNKSFQGDQAALLPQHRMQGVRLVSDGNLFGMRENILSLNSVSRNAPMQEFQGGQQQAGWSGNLQEKAINQLGTSQGFVSLDPGEEKISFSSDDHIWDPSGVRSSVTGAGGYGNPLESTENLNLFPSLQSGTWSALMQSAVAEASSSDTGLQDDWNGLSLQRTELSTENQTTMLNDSGKQQTDWNDSHLQNTSSTSRPFPLFDDVKMSQSGQNASIFKQSGAKSSFGQSERVHHNAYESMQQSSKENNRWLDNSPEQKSLVEGNHHVQPSVLLENVSQTAWPRQMHGQSESAAHATNIASSGQNMHGWVHRQGMLSYNVDSENCNKPANWNNNETPSPSGDPSLKISENESSLHRSQRSQRSDLKMGMQIERDYDGGMWKVDDNHVANSFSNLASGTVCQHTNREDSRTNSFTVTPNSNTPKATQENQQVLNSHHLDYRKHMVDSSGKSKVDENAGKYQHQLGSQVLESSAYNSESGMDETYDMRRDNCLRKELSSDSYNSNQSQPTAKGVLSKDNPWLIASDSPSLASGNQTFVGQAQHQQPSQGSKSNEQEYFGHPKFVGNAPDNSVDSEKEHLPELQGNVKGLVSFDGSAGFSSQGKRTAQTSQNMLELLHKVDRSSEHATPSHLGSSDPNFSSNMPEVESSNASVSHQWRNQSAASQGFGLRLGPPSQRMAATSHASPSQNSTQAANDLNSRQIDSREGEKSQTWLSPTSSVQSGPHEASQREHWDNSSGNSGQMGNEPSHSNLQVNSAAFMSPLPYSQNQLQSPLMPSASGPVMRNLSVKNGVADQSTQPLIPRTVNRNPPFNLSSPEDTSQQINTNMPFARVSGQQFPVLESVPISQPSAMAGRSQQGTYSTMLQNVWTNVSSNPHLSGGPSHRASQNLFHSNNPSNTNVERTSMVEQKLDRQDTGQGGNGSEFGTCSINSQRFAYGEEQSGKESNWQQMPTQRVDPSSQKTGASLGQESAMKQPLGAIPIASGSLGARHAHQQEVDGGRYGKDPALFSQREHLSTQNLATSSRDIEGYNRSVKQSLATNHGYSLLHQVQAMRSMEADPNTRDGKRLKLADSDTDAQHVTNKSGQQAFDGYNATVRDSMGSDLNAAVRRTPFSTGHSKMLSFSSEGREEQNPNASSQIMLGDVPSQDIVGLGQSDSLSRSIHHTVPSARSENPQISPQMAPSWFQQYGTYKTGQILPTHEALSSMKPVSQQFIYAKPSESLDAHTSSEQVIAVKASQVGSVSTMPTLVAGEQAPPHSLPSVVTDQTLIVVRPKKRKTEISVRLPWHKEITHGLPRLQDISMAELDWAHSANRLVEKVEDDVELAEDGHPMIRPRRRLVITTQLMQQLLRPAPPAILSVQASSNYESVIYFVAKLALGEACRLISCSRSDSHLPTANGNAATEKLKNSKKVANQYFSEVVEDFVARAKNLESEFLRLDRKASLLDLRVECQDLERFSVINRFAKFHGRGGAQQADGAEASSSSSGAVASTPRTIPQRYVVAVAMPKNLPEGVHCLSL